MQELLVVSGEASGDRAAAHVLRALPGTRAFGMGGAASEAEGAELLVHLRDGSAMGVLDVAARGFAIAQAYAGLRAAAARRRPAAALLVNYTDFNLRLARRLRALRIRTLWYVAPQVWAWRAGRVRTVRARVDKLAVILPFEERLWRDAGVDAAYVGHPALDTVRLDREDARRELGLVSRKPAVALLPGSRPMEIRRLLPAMLAAVREVPVEARMLLAPSLDDVTRAWARARARDAGVASHDVEAMDGAPAHLAAFDAALCASGTASLEAALAGAIPVVCYRVDALAALLVRPLLRTKHIALPNVLLGRRAFPELLQGEATATAMARALETVLVDRPRNLAACDEVRAVLGPRRTPGSAVAAMLAPWLER
jgi:lipid-A-disaccharide synthase